MQLPQAVLCVLANSSLSVLEAIKLVNIMDVSYMVDEALEKVKTESVMKVKPC